MQSTPNEEISALLARWRTLQAQERRAWSESYALSEEMRALERELHAAYEAQIWAEHPGWARDLPTPQARVRRLAEGMRLRTIWRERGATPGATTALPPP